MTAADVLAQATEAVRQYSFAGRVLDFKRVACEDELRGAELVRDRRLVIDPLISVNDREHAFEHILSTQLHAVETPILQKMQESCATRYSTFFDMTAFQWMRDSFVPGAELALVLSLGVWDGIVGDSDFAGLYEPCEDHETMASGVLGRVDGVVLITDGYRIPSCKTLPDGFAFMCRTGALDRFAEMRTWCGPLHAESVSPHNTSCSYKTAMAHVRAHNAVCFQRVTGS